MPNITFFPSSVRALLLAAALLSSVAVASATTLDGDRRLLAVAQSQALIRPACGRVAMSLRAESKRSRAGDTSLAAFTNFVRSRRSVVDRAWCLRNTRNLVRTSPPSAYIGAIENVQYSMLTSEYVNDQLVGARAACGDPTARTGGELIRLAQPGRNVDVRIAALTNMSWPMLLDIRGGTSYAVYDRVIIQAMRDRANVVVVAALDAYAGLHGAAADPVLLEYGVIEIRLFALARPLRSIVGWSPRKPIEPVPAGSTRPL